MTTAKVKMFSRYVVVYVVVCASGFILFAYLTGSPLWATFGGALTLAVLHFPKSPKGPRRTSTRNKPKTHREGTK